MVSVTPPSSQGKLEVHFPSKISPKAAALQNNDTSTITPGNPSEQNSCFAHFAKLLLSLWNLILSCFSPVTEEEVEEKVRVDVDVVVEHVKTVCTEENLSLYLSWQELFTKKNVQSLQNYQTNLLIQDEGHSVSYYPYNESKNVICFKIDTSPLTLFRICPSDNTKISSKIELVRSAEKVCKGRLACLIVPKHESLTIHQGTNKLMGIAQYEETGFLTKNWGEYSSRYKQHQANLAEIARQLTILICKANLANVSPFLFVLSPDGSQVLLNNLMPSEEGYGVREGLLGWAKEGHPNVDLPPGLISMLPAHAQLIYDTAFDVLPFLEFEAIAEQLEAAVAKAKQSQTKGDQ